MPVIKNKTKGVSLPMAIGLVSLILLISVGANELIIRAIRSVQKIESSDKAYFAAEAGIEDALYELSPHFAGYETPDLDDENIRKDSFDTTGTITWNNEWTIRSHDETCAEGWTSVEDLCGNFYENQKLIISLFNDNSSSIPASNAINTNILPNDADINTISIMNFSVKFRVPIYVAAENPGSFNTLTIDNDGDMGVVTTDYGINEDEKNATPSSNCSYLPAGVQNDDDDCDGRENEDSPEDTFIYWKISDGAGNSLSPIRGCITDAIPGSQICEKDFALTGTNELSFTLSDTYTGACEGAICATLPLTPTINNFLTAASSNPINPNAKLQVEFNIVAPLEQADITNNRKIAIPYLEYGIDYSGDNVIPAPNFTIKSDGYHRDFKQSITATISPKTAVPLFDFTIIQQQ